MIKTIFSILILMVSISAIRANCRESYVVFCDCVRHLQDYKSANWTDLVVDATNHSCSTTVGSDNFDNLEEIKLLFIVNHVDNVEEMTFKTVGESLKFVKFYGNRLTHIAASAFSGFRKLNQLSLVNNNIEHIEPYAFRHSEIENLDLSRNNLETLLENTFKECKISIIKIQFNKLTYIGDDTFNGNLEVLRLDYNNLEYIQRGFVRNLPRLKELSLSHNELSHISDIKSLETLNKLDFSFNRINAVESSEFEDLKDLIYLDLSNNKLETFSLKYFKKIKAEKMMLSLSFNLLTNLEIITDVKPMTLVLFGNPWNCKCLTKMEREMVENKFFTTKCDREHFKSGRFPICVEQGECKSEPIGNRDDLRRFGEVIKSNQNQLSCDLSQEVGTKYVVSAQSQN